MIINILFIVIVVAVTSEYNLDFLYTGLQRQTNDFGRADLLNLWSLPGLNYGIIALVVAMGQVFLDQGWYSKALSAVSEKSMKWSLIVGIFVLWMPIPFISAYIFGHGAIALGVDNNDGWPLHFTAYFANPLFGVLFAVMMFSIGIGASAKCLVGIQALFAADFYKNKLMPDAGSAEKIRFGRLMVICIGVLSASIATALAGIPLLTIDTFCGIFFAAPCGALIAGMYLKRVNELIALLSIAGGLTLGFGAWAWLDNGWFVGTIASLVVPFWILLPASQLNLSEFNFYKLRHYRG